MTIIYCDCCGKELTINDMLYERHRKNNPIVISKRTGYVISGEPVDLCVDCNSEFQALYKKLCKKNKRTKEEIENAKTDAIAKEDKN